MARKVKSFDNFVDEVVERKPRGMSITAYNYRDISIVDKNVYVVEYKLTPGNLGRHTKKYIEPIFSANTPDYGRINPGDQYNRGISMLLAAGERKDFFRGLLEAHGTVVEQLDGSSQITDGGIDELRRKAASMGIQSAFAAIPESAQPYDKIVRLNEPTSTMPSFRADQV